MNETFKPCPFCGSVLFVHITHDPAKNHRYAECEDCGSTGPRAKTWEQAKEAWQRRK